MEKSSYELESLSRVRAHVNLVACCNCARVTVAIMGGLLLNCESNASRNIAALPHFVPGVFLLPHNVVHGGNTTSAAPIASIINNECNTCVTKS